LADRLSHRGCIPAARLGRAPSAGRACSGPPEQSDGIDSGSSLRATFASRKRPSFGGWGVIPGGFTAQIQAYAGFDWLCIDMQHGVIGYTELRSMVQAVRPTGVPILVRLSSNTGSEIMRALDVGADGVVVPLVGSAAEAASAVAACRYPPDGVRS